MNTACLYFIAAALWHIAATGRDRCQCYLFSAFLVIVGAVVLGFTIAEFY